jgi:hypothetical protein
VAFSIKKRDNGLLKLPLSLSCCPQSLKFSVLDEHLARRVELHEVVDFGLRDSACRQHQFFEIHQVHQRGYLIDLFASGWNQDEIIKELPELDKEDILAALKYEPNARPSSYYSGDNKSQKHPQEEIGLKPGFILRYPHTPD